MSAHVRCDELLGNAVPHALTILVGVGQSYYIKTLWGRMTLASRPNRAVEIWDRISKYFPALKFVKHADEENAATKPLQAALKVHSVCVSLEDTQSLCFHAPYKHNKPNPLDRM